MIYRFYVILQSFNWSKISCFDLNLDKSPSWSHPIAIKLFDLKPDIVLIDVNVPDYNILDFTKEVLAKHEHCGLILTTKENIKTEKSFFLSGSIKRKDLMAIIT